MKAFAIVHHLIADSGHRVAVVKADSKEQALAKYIKIDPHAHLGADAIEITDDVQIVLDYDNPNYEG